MKKSVAILALFLVLATALFSFGCGSAEELKQAADEIQGGIEEITGKAADLPGSIGEIAGQAKDLQEGLDKLKDAADGMQGDIQVEPGDGPSEPAVAEEPPAEPAVKTITVWLRDGVREATINGQALEPGIDNKLEIDPSQPLVGEWDYTDRFGRESHATASLDSYYDYFMLEELGGWSQTIHPDEYEEVKITGIR